MSKRNNLVLDRKPGERIILEWNEEIVVIEVKSGRRGKVTLAIQARDNVQIWREELYHPSQNGSD